jgi:hypothetical protein
MVVIEEEFDFDCDNAHQDAVAENIVALVKMLDKISDNRLKEEIKSTVMEMCNDSFLFGLTFQEQTENTIQ